MSKDNFGAAVLRGIQRYGSETFVVPKINKHQLRFFGDPQRVEITSPSGYVRRGCISMTTGWAPSLLLIHRRGQHGSWDLLTDKDVVSAWITLKGKRIPIEENAFEAAVYAGLPGEKK